MPKTLSGGKSIFARQIAAQRVKEGTTSLHCADQTIQKHETNMETDQCNAVDDGE